MASFYSSIWLGKFNPLNQVRLYRNLSAQGFYRRWKTYFQSSLYFLNDNHLWIEFKPYTMAKGKTLLAIVCIQYIALLAMKYAGQPSFLLFIWWSRY